MVYVLYLYIHNLKTGVKKKSFRALKVRLDDDLFSLPPAAQSGVNWSNLFRATSHWIVNVSKDGDSIISLRKLF